MERLDEDTVRTLGDLLPRERRSGAVAVRADGDTDHVYTYQRFLTTAWKTGNFFRHLGVREGVTVGIVAEPRPQPLLGLFGAALLGAQVRLDPPEAIDARVVLAPTDRIDLYELPPGGQRVGYGANPNEPTVRYFEENVWSENPTVPPEDRDPGAAVLVTDDAAYSHERLLRTAFDTVDRLSLAPGEMVAVRAPLADPRTVAAGVLAPLLAGGAVQLGADGSDADAEIVADEEPATDRWLDISDIDL
ncbi:long-chain fatty acid--CoA ligase [Natranaeroarchaeum aerophilus]|uniref:Long-chain fatty acid--CoA ligase n=1 Tax=Natranaeroarchaeum aerophilus TaxID=2917711 RepID=A0AAE3FS12_9EURY|nr:long-chain fatty acid--CoA ligase [Natranaeroarchaeum aerophilus]MCL9814111.1 long-chain fatty acid--CoA ligase [Natranaeroarchaeum aerophilus]